jgi:predicted anti-sigma-YlaC factor YlaD
MQCKQIDELMMKYLDGNISELELEQLYRHNQKCAACAEEFEILKDAIFEIEELPDIEPPAGLTANIMAAVANQKHFHVNAKQIICWVMGFVGLVLFTYNIISYVLLPMMGIAPLVSFQSVLDVVYMLAGKAKDSFISMSLYLGKLMVLRNILFREYTLFIFLWLTAFAAADIMLYKMIRIKKKRNIADWN